MNRGHVIITGATGFIGSACVREFLARGWRVTALGHRRGGTAGSSPSDGEFDTSRLRDLRDAPGLHLVAGSVTDRDNLLRILAEAITATGGTCQALVHCAGRASDIGWDRAFRTTNLVGTQNVCRAVEQLGIGRLIQMSTTDVYGVRDFFDADEQTPHTNNRRNPYPKYKILAEAHIRAVLPPDRFAILRPAFVWGPGDATVLPRAIAFLRSSPAILHFGGWRGRNRWPLAYVGNVARAAFAAATCDAAAGEVYNVVDAEPITMDEYYRMLIELFLPQRRSMRSVTLPFGLMWPAAALSTALSTLLGRRQPVFDPSLYGLRHISHSQAFSGVKVAGLLADCGLGFIDRDAALEELRAWASRPAPGSR